MQIMQALLGVEHEALISKINNLQKDVCFLHAFDINKWNMKLATLPKGTYAVIHFPMPLNSQQDH